MGSQAQVESQAESQACLQALPQYGPSYLAAPDPLGAVLSGQEKECEDFQQSLPACDSIYGNIPSWCFQHHEHYPREECERDQLCFSAP